ncbi:MAG: hypothetical protein ABI343_20925, partial [Burkholderiaceae bacterium]
MAAARIKFLGLILLLATCNSDAMTLGRLRGAALIGQSLDVTVPVQLDAGETATSQCFEAEVFQGDSRQDPSRVQVVLEPTQTPQSSTLRIASSNLVDEPIVTVYVRSVCPQKLSRRYVMLADVASDQLAPTPQLAPQLPMLRPTETSTPSSRVDRTAPATASAGSSATDEASPPRPVRSTPRRARRARPANSARPTRPSLAERASANPGTPVVQARPAPVVETPKAAPSAGQARLKLDPAELLSTPAPAPAPSAVVSAPSEIEARAALDAQRLESLEASVKQLVATAARNEATLKEVRTQLQQAEAQRYRNPLIYALVALLLLCLLAILVLLARRGRQRSDAPGPWWGGSASQDGAATIASQETRPASSVRPSVFPDTSAPAPLVISEPRAPTPAALQKRGLGPGGPAPVTQVDVSLVEMSESSFDRLMQSDASHSAVRKPGAPAASSAPTSARKLIDSEELFDIRQQAEFYVSLGQTDQAVRILENRIGESGESSPMAYLDLLKIFHSLGLKADFRQVRDDFNVLFNARVPEFSDFSNEGRDLEHYPELLARITASWRTPEIFSDIEMWLFRRQREASAEYLDLAAFRDLLLLHAIAQNVAAGPDSTFGAPAPNVILRPASVPGEVG